MQTDFLAAVRQIAAERGIEQEDIIEAIKHAIRVGFKKDYPDPTLTEEGEVIENTDGATLHIEIDPDQGKIEAFADKKVVDEVTNPPTQIALEDARKIEPNLNVGDHVQVEVTHTGDFGRVAAQAARQVIMQKIRESERDAIVKQFEDKLGTVESAVVQRMDRDNTVIVEIYRATALMPQEEQIPSEFYKSGARLKVLLKEISEDAKGKNLIVSRSSKDFLTALFEMEVPEIASGTVEIMGVAREAGSRSKVSVKSNADGVDPIGSCVGQRGSRINAITNELKTGKTEEKIDIIPWDEDTATYIGNAIRPAEALDVKIINEEERQALIIVNDEYLSLAIGRDGQNVRLAAKLTGWKLDIQGEKMYEDNGRKSKFELDAAGKTGVKTAKPEPKKEVVEEVDESTEAPEAASELEGLGLGTRVVNALTAAGINSEAELRSAVDAEQPIEGIGPKSLEEIKQALNG